MTEPAPEELLRLAVGAAHEAAALLRDGRESGDLEVGTKTSPTDVVTAMDRAAERLLVDRLLGARPDDGVLGEEGSDHAGTSGVRWVVDPLDGTVNYLYRLPNWCVSIGAEVAGDVVAGVVVDPSHGRTYTAVRGGGAYRDGVRLRGSAQHDLAQALVATGFGYETERRRRQAEALRVVLPAVRDIRRFGSAALDLCGAAEGIVDAYYERGLNPWDLAAGGLVAREAGLRVAGLHGRPPSEDLVIAAPPALFEPLHDLVAPLHPDAD